MVKPRLQTGRPSALVLRIQGGGDVAGTLSRLDVGELAGGGSHLAPVRGALVVRHIDTQGVRRHRDSRQSYVLLHKRDVIHPGAVRKPLVVTPSVICYGHARTPSGERRSSPTCRGGKAAGELREYGTQSTACRQACASGSAANICPGRGPGVSRPAHRQRSSFEVQSFGR